MEVTKIQTVEEYEKPSQTTVTVENFEAPFPDLPEEKITDIVVLPDEIIESEIVDKDGQQKVIKTKKRVIKKPKDEFNEEVTEIDITEQESGEPLYTITINDLPITEPTHTDKKSIELPEQVSEIEVISPDGTKKKKTVKTRAFKKNIDDNLDEVTTVNTIEEENMEPITSVHVEIVPVDETCTSPIPIEELPEETVIEELSEDKKPRKKTTKTRTFKKQGPEEEEYYQIQTIEEEGKEPYSLVRVVSDENIADIIDISKLDDEQLPKHKKQKPHKQRGKNTNHYTMHTLHLTRKLKNEVYAIFILYSSTILSLG